MTKRKPFTLPASWQVEPYPGHWSFAYEPNAARREDYDFRVTFGKGVRQSEQLAVIALLEAAPRLLDALEEMVSIELDLDEGSRNFGAEHLRELAALIAQATGRAA